MARYRRKRCVCGKIVYRTELEAREAIRSIPLHRGYHFLRPYLCGKAWHVGHDHKMYDRLAAHYAGASMDSIRKGASDDP